MGIKIQDIAYVRFGAPALDVMEAFLGEFGMIRTERTGAPIVRQEGRSRQSVQGDYRRGHRLEINAVAVLV
jgi:hypothetical protein